MKTKAKSRFLHIHCIIVSFAVLGLVKPAYSQSLVQDSTIHPYHINYWVTGGIFVVGIPAAIIGAPWVSNKAAVTNADIQALDRSDLTAMDRWALSLDASNRGSYARLSDNVLAGAIVLPALTMLDHNIRQDWLDVALMYAETQIIVNDIYLYSPFGPTFLNRLRPVVYYDEFADTHVRTTAWNRSSFYSGHVAAAASASFFTAKVFCDYHPDLAWKKYLVYGAASIPPLIVGYLRFKALFHFPSDIIVGYGIGVLCGIGIPELHRISSERITLGIYSSSEGTGITLKWRPDFRE